MARILIVGLGALGSVYASLMKKAGHEVHAVGKDRAHVAATAEHGLRTSGASGDNHVYLDSVTDRLEAPDQSFDLIVIATKAYDVREAARDVAGVIAPRTVVQTIQNGEGSAGDVAEELGEEQLAIGVVGGFGASVPTPGHAHHNGMAMVRTAPYSSLSMDRVEQVKDIWRSSGFDAVVFDDHRRMIWEKLIMNVAFSGPSVVTGCTIGELLEREHAWPVSRGCLLEAYSVAVALGVDIDVGDPVKHVRALGSSIPHAKPSMLLDFEAGRRGEVDAINGSIVRLARTCGVSTPVNSTVVNLVKTREESLFADDSLNLP